MAALGPFEARPHIAVAVSGGPDSLALTLLCHHWATARQGQAVALNVDHRLRAGSAEEAKRVRRWLAVHGIPCRSLVWKRAGGRPMAAIQAKARSARYGLMTGWCRRQGVLHLALAHHAGDQAETVLMRLSRGGGPDGLAGMSAIAAREGVRIIRPLLAMAPERLRATLAAVGQEWIEDPSNRNPVFERVRWRRSIPAGLVPELASAASEIGEERRRRESELADLLAAARIDPAGFLGLPLAALRQAPAQLAERALSRCLIAIGGNPYAPSLASLARLRESLFKGSAGRTLGGCRIICRGERLLICREAAAARERIPAKAAKALRWDGRFDIFATGASRAGRVTISRLGEAGRDRLPAATRDRSIPREAAAALPAFWRGGRAILPHIGHDGSGGALFRPAQPLVPPGFTVAKMNVNII